MIQIPIILIEDELLTLSYKELYYPARFREPDTKQPERLMNSLTNEEIPLVPSGSSWIGKVDKGLRLEDIKVI